MKPAISVIFLTTLAGAGQGLFLAYFSADVLSRLSILPPISTTSQGDVLAGLISLGLLLAGLIASFFHLGHPERAWRAAAMWRTSWLSREVLVLPVTMALIFIYTLLKFIDNQDIMMVLGNGYALEWSTVIGFIGLLAVFALYLCTAMIYACLKFLRQWHSPLTVLNFILLGSASGFTLAAALATFSDPMWFGYFAEFAIVLSIAGLASRYVTLLRNKNLRSPTTLQSAIGIHHPTIRQMAQGAMGGSFNTRAFIHTYGATVVKLARRFFLLAAFAVPVILLFLSNEASIMLCVAAFLVQYTGLLVERWYFFIEAEHPQNVYYQMIS
jgi:DMSO reductase anchor subunit